MFYIWIDPKKNNLPKVCRFKSFMAGCLLPFLLVLFFIQPAAAKSSQDAFPIYQPTLEASISANSAIVIDSGRARRLYAKNADKHQAIPVASKVMTALLACERLPLSTQVTISNVAAMEAQKEVTGDGLTLEIGDKYPLEYLLLRLVFYDSNAAALAIAEQISNVEEIFVELMNSKAASLELADTRFLNSTGDPVYENQLPGQSGSTDLPDNPFEQVPLQYSTASDLARLMQYAMSNQNFANIIRKDSDYLILSGNTLVPMQNRIKSIWTLSENRITGACYAERTDRSFGVAVGRVNDFNMIMVVVDGSPGQRINDMLVLTNAIEDNYVQKPLVTAGEPFTGYQEKTVDGETFGLVFKRTVQYVQPINDNFLQPHIQYISYGPHHRPIESSMTVGQVVFELKDGTTIAVDIGPDRQILSNISFLNQLLNNLQSNRNLFYIVLVSGYLLLAAMAYQLITRIIRLFRLVQFVLIERQTRH